MRKTKFEQRIENALDAFFDDEILVGENSSIRSGTAKFLQKNILFPSTEKAENLAKILKQIFLFFPGVIFLFGLSSLITFIPLINQYNTIKLNKPLSFLITYIASVLFVWFGIGDLKNPKHLIIPASIAMTGLIVGLAAALGTIWFRLFPLLSDVSQYSIYFLPLAFIIPFLAKGWVDKGEIER
jgi:hypothetical protein